MTSILLADLECDGMHRGLKSDKKSAIYRGAALCLYHQRRIKYLKKKLATETNTELFIIIFQRRFLEKKTSPKKSNNDIGQIEPSTSHISKSVHFCRYTGILPNFK